MSVPDQISREKGFLATAAFAPLTQAGELADGWIVEHSKPATEGDIVRFEISKGFYNLDHCLDLRIDSQVKWFRMMKKVDDALLQQERLRVRLIYAAECPDAGPKQPLGYVGIFGYERGYGAAHSRVDDPLSVTPEISVVDGLVEAGSSINPEKEYYIVLQLNRPARLRILDFQIGKRTAEGDLRVLKAPADTQSQAGAVHAPYRTSKFPVSEQLARLNDGMDRWMKKEPETWSSGMLRIAVRLEDYATASGIVNYMLARWSVAADHMIKSLPQIIDTLVAVGDRSALTDLAIDIALKAGPRKDEALASLLPILAREDTGVGETVDAVGDRLALNAMLETNPGNVSLSQVLRSIRSKGDAEDHLVLANYFRACEPGRQQRELNTYFRSFGLPFEIELGDPAGNILKDTRFIAAGNMDRDASGIAQRPLVSVIMAAYNCAGTLGYAVDSVLGQSYENLELLVASDCSTDETEAEMQRYAGDPRVKLFRSEKNQGPYNIRNALIKEARGDYITFHDSDDLALPHRIERQISTMIRDNTYVSVGRWLRIRPNGQFVMFRDGAFLRMCVNSIMFHRQVFELFGPYRSVMFGADSEFYEKVRSMLGPDQVSQIESPGVLGLWSGSSLTKTPGIEADEHGFRAPRRRLYAGLAGRQRMLGDLICPEEDFERVLREHDIFRDPYPLHAIKE